MRNILIANDDGYEALGLEILIKVASNFGNVYVSAPQSQQSGMSHAIDIDRIQKIEEIEPIFGSRRTIISETTPAQCVVNGISVFNDVDFDLVLSGINRGLNVATDVSYSGTVGIIKEAMLSGINSVAFSAEDINAPFLEDEIYKILDEVFKKKSHKNGSGLNINIPKDKPLGVRYTKMGKRRFHVEMEKRSEENLYNKVLSRKLYDEDSNTDVVAIEAGFVSITPIQIDQTNYRVLEILSKKLR